MKLFFVGILVFAVDSSFAACSLNDRILGTRISIQSGSGDEYSFKDAQNIQALNLVISDIKPGQAYSFLYSSFRHYAELVGKQIAGEDDTERLSLFKKECEVLQSPFVVGRANVAYRGIVLEGFRDDFRNACIHQPGHLEWLKKHKVDAGVLVAFADALSKYTQDDEGAVEGFLGYINQRMSDRQ